jgi:hypothetical protein
MVDYTTWSLARSISQLRTDVNVLIWLVAEMKQEHKGLRYVTYETYCNIYDHTAVEETDDQQQPTAQGALDRNS